MDENLVIKGSAFLEKGVAQAAIDLAAPAIHEALTNVAKRYALHVVILDPTFAWNPELDSRRVIVHEESFGRGTLEEPGKDWNSVYERIARSKAFLSWRYGRPSREIGALYPHLFVEGQTRWPGSVVRHGIIVACSGVEAYFDEMFAGWIADAIYALCLKEMAEVPASVDFIRLPPGR